PPSAHHPPPRHSPPRRSSDRLTGVPAPSPGPATRRQPPPADGTLGEDSRLNSKYTFDTFVIGSSNRFAQVSKVYLLFRRESSPSDRQSTRLNSSHVSISYAGL